MIPWKRQKISHEGSVQNQDNESLEMKSESWIKIKESLAKAVDCRN